MFVSMGEPLQDRVVAALGHQYLVEHEIGRGGMSVVYRARDLRLNRTVAIKVLPPELAYDPAVRMRFTREAQTAAQLAHAHIVPIYDVGERDGIAYFVMAMITGGNVASLLVQEPRQPLDDARRIICEIADALSYAHARGVIHRDIKPDNILLDRDTGRAVVTDFGIARAMEGGTRLTVTGIAVGTPTYMSPEQAEGDREVDGRSDIYSLGVLAYQMVTGRVPFTGGNSMALLLKHVTERPRPVAELRPDAPKALRDAIERALMKSPEDRWPTASALRDALTADASQGAAWRAERREPVRYTSPVPRSVRRADVPPMPRAPGQLIIEPEHLASFTPEQRADIRLWNGRIHLRDRVRAMRGYAWLTAITMIAGIVAMGAGLAEGFPPAILAPVIPLYMTRKAWQRGKSLRASGLKLRRVLLMPRAKWVIAVPPAPPTDRMLEKLAPREILEGPLGSSIRRAVEDRNAILSIAAGLSKADREMLPDLAPTVNALVERVAQLTQGLDRLEHGFDPRLVRDIEARILEEKSGGGSPDDERRLGLLERQRGSLESLAQRRSVLTRQLDNASLALGNLRLDLVKLRSSGIQSALSDVSNATQEARTLSREIGVVLEAAAEIRGL